MKHLQLVLDFATEKHKGQKRKDGKDYITHPIAVAEIAVRMARQENQFSEKYIQMIYVISLAHDFWEDTNATEDEFKETLSLTSLFTNFEISQIIAATFDLTRVSKISSVLSYLETIKGNHLAHIVKLADLEHNLSDLGPGNLRDKYHLCRWFLES